MASLAARPCGQFTPRSGLAFAPLRPRTLMHAQPSKTPATPAPVTNSTTPAKATPASPFKDTAPKAAAPKASTGLQKSAPASGDVALVSKLEDYAVDRNVPQDVVMMVIDMLARAPADGKDLAAMEARLDTTMARTAASLEAGIAKLERAQSESASVSSKEVRDSVAQLAATAEAMSAPRPANELDAAVKAMRSEAAARDAALRSLVIGCTFVLLLALAFVHPAVVPWLMSLMGSS